MIGVPMESNGIFRFLDQLTMLNAGDKLEIVMNLIEVSKRFILQNWNLRRMI